MKLAVILLATILTLPAMAQNKKEMKEPIVLISVEGFGDIKLKLYNETPIHRDNFLKLAKAGKYDGSKFHRVIQNFMIQGGSMADEGSMQQLPAEIVPKYHHKYGALAAARLPDHINPDKKSSPCQFYIVQGQKYDAESLPLMEDRLGFTFSEEAKKDYMEVGGTPHLDGGYTVFGEVLEGMDVVEKIAAVKKMQADQPVEDVKFTVKVLE